MSDEAEAAPATVRRITWRLPVFLCVSGFVLKVALSLVVSDAAGDVVGGALGFASLVACLLLARQRHGDEVRARASEASDHE